MILRNKEMSFESFGKRYIQKILILLLEQI